MRPAARFSNAVNGNPRVSPGAGGGAVLAMAAATVGVLGHERDCRAILRWNGPAATD